MLISHYSIMAEYRVMHCITRNHLVTRWYGGRTGRNAFKSTQCWADCDRYVIASVGATWLAPTMHTVRLQKKYLLKKIFKNCIFITERHLYSLSISCSFFCCMYLCTAVLFWRDHCNDGVYCTILPCQLGDSMYKTGPKTKNNKYWGTQSHNYLSFPCIGSSIKTIMKLVLIV